MTVHIRLLSVTFLFRNSAKQDWLGPDWTPEIQVWWKSESVTDGPIYPPSDAALLRNYCQLIGMSLLNRTRSAGPESIGRK